MSGPKVPTKRLTATCWHEAGHALAAFAERVAIRAVTVIPDEESLGEVAHYPYPSWFHPDVASYDDLRHRALLESHIVISFAGLEAEKLFTGRYNYVGASVDFHGAVDLATYLTGSTKETEAYLRWLRVRAQALVTNRRTFIAGLADVLLVHRSMSGRAVRSAIQDILQAAVSANLPAEISRGASGNR